MCRTISRATTVMLRLTVTISLIETLFGRASSDNTRADLSTAQTTTNLTDLVTSSTQRHRSEQWRPLPPGLIEWKENANRSVDVIWSSQSETCSTLNTCHGLKLTSDEDLVKQLKPISIQPGVDVRLLTTVNDEYVAYLTDAIGFDSCNKSKGRLLSYDYSNPHQQMIVIPAKLLYPSQSHYVIAVRRKQRTGANESQTSDSVTLETSLSRSDNNGSRSSDDVDADDADDANDDFSSSPGRLVLDCFYGLRLNITVRLGVNCGNNRSNINNSNNSNNSSSVVGSSINDSSRWVEAVAADSVQVCLDSGGRCVTDFYSKTYYCLQWECNTSSSSSLPSFSSSCPGSDTSSCSQKSTCVLDTSGGQHCIDTNVFYTAMCPDDIIMDSCATKPCVHGICVQQPGERGYSCYCIPGYGGLRCDTVYTESVCVTRPCRNEGTCLLDPDSPTGYRCNCSTGYNGVDCETKADFCRSNPCPQVCRDYGHYYVCDCRPGFSGARCEMNIDECASDPCQNGGSCHDVIDGYNCACVNGFHGPHCELHSLDLTFYAISHRPPLHSALTVALTLCGAFLIAISVIVGCYCKINGVSSICFRSKNGYQKHVDEFRSSKMAARFTSCADGGDAPLSYTCPIEITTDETVTWHSSSCGSSAAAAAADVMHEYRELSANISCVNYNTTTNA